MTPEEQKSRIITMIHSLIIDQKIKDFIISKIDILDMKQLIEILKNYSKNINNINKKNKEIISTLNQKIQKYENSSNEFFDEKNSLDELELFITNM